MSSPTSVTPAGIERAPVTDRALMQLHLYALYTTNEHGRLLLVNEPNGAVAPRFVFARTTAGNEWRFRDDLADDVVAELDSLCRVEPPGIDDSPQPINIGAYSRALSRHAPIRTIYTGPAYHFPPSLQVAPDTVLIDASNAHLLRPHFEAWLDEVSYRQPFVAYIRDDHAVSVCCSVRITTGAHEAGVETAPAFRARGYALATVAAWAARVAELGCVPLYSTSWQNTASRALAQSLGLIQFGSVLHIT